MQQLSQRIKVSRMKQLTVMNFFGKSLIKFIGLWLTISGIDCLKLIESDPEPNPSLDSSSTGLKLTLNGLVRQLSDREIIKSLINGRQTASPRLTLDFLADPALFVSILHTLEVAYWSMPLGFLLMPIINFFRMPNKRRQLKTRWLLLARSLKRSDLNRYQERLLKGYEKYN